MLSNHRCLTVYCIMHWWGIMQCGPNLQRVGYQHCPSESWWHASLFCLKDELEIQAKLLLCKIKIKKQVLTDDRWIGWFCFYSFLVQRTGLLDIKYTWVLCSITLSFYRSIYLSVCNVYKLFLSLATCHICSVEGVLALSCVLSILLFWLESCFGRYPRVLKRVSSILNKEGLQNANIFHIFEYKLTLTDPRLITSKWLVEVKPFWAKRLMAYIKVQGCSNYFRKLKKQEKGRNKKKQQNMVAGMRANAASATRIDFEVVTGMTSKLPVFSGNHGTRLAVR